MDICSHRDSETPSSFRLVIGINLVHAIAMNRYVQWLELCYTGKDIDLKLGISRVVCHRVKLPLMKHCQLYEPHPCFAKIIP